MSVQSSYLFLRNTILNKKTDNDENKDDDIIPIEEDISYYINQTFPDFVTNKEQSSPFKEVLTGRWDLYEIKFTVRKSDGLYSVDIEICNANYEQSVIDCLETVQNKMLSSGLRKHYIDIISYDAVSEYYCNRIMPLLNTFERSLRKLLYNVYVLNFGVNYHLVTVDSELRDKVHGVVNTTVTKEQRDRLRADYHMSNKEVDKLILIKLFFDSFDYSDLQKLLFVPSWTELEANERDEFLNNNTDLSALTDDELRQSFRKFTPQSDWDRLFSDKIHADKIEDKIASIGKHRNKAAHFKQFSSREFEFCQELIHNLNKAVLKAIEVSENADFVRKYKEGVMKASTQSLLQQETMVNRVTMITSMFAELLKYHTLFDGRINNKTFQLLSNVLSLFEVNGVDDDSYEESDGKNSSTINDDEEHTNDNG